MFMTVQESEARSAAAAAQQSDQGDSLGPSAPTDAAAEASSMDDLHKHDSKQQAGTERKQQ